MFLDDVVVVQAKKCGGGFVDNFVVDGVVVAFPSPREVLSHSTVTSGTFGEGDGFYSSFFPSSLLLLLSLQLLMLLLMTSPLFCTPVAPALKFPYHWELVSS